MNTWKDIRHVVVNALAGNNRIPLSVAKKTAERQHNAKFGPGTGAAVVAQAGHDPVQQVKALVAALDSAQPAPVPPVADTRTTPVKPAPAAAASWPFATVCALLNTVAASKTAVRDAVGAYTLAPVADTPAHRAKILAALWRAGVELPDLYAGFTPSDYDRVAMETREHRLVAAQKHADAFRAIVMDHAGHRLTGTAAEIARDYVQSIS